MIIFNSICPDINIFDERAALQSTTYQRSGEAFNGIEPGNGPRGVVEHPMGMARQPGPHLRVGAGAIVDGHDVDDLAGRHSGLDGVEEAQKLLVPVALRAAADQVLFQYVQRGK